jgi:hypothetical protein
MVYAGEQKHARARLGMAIYHLQGKGLMGDAITVNFTQQQNGNYTIDESLGKKIVDAIGDKEGYFAFYLSFAKGFHSMMVIVDKTGKDASYPRFYMGDQGTAIRGGTGQGWSTSPDNIFSEFNRGIDSWNGDKKSGFINQANNLSTGSYLAPQVTVWPLFRPEKKQ